MTKYVVASGLVTETKHHAPISKKLPFHVWSQNTAFAVAFSGNDVDNLLASLQAESVEIDNPTKIKDFLAKHNYMLEYMYSIPSKVSEYFGNTNLKLSLLRDFDSETDNPELFIEVQISLSPQEANKRLEKIYKEWFIPLGMGLDKLNISLNFY